MPQHRDDDSALERARGTKVVDEKNAALLLDRSLEARMEHAIDDFTVIVARRGHVRSAITRRGSGVEP